MGQDRLRVTIHASLDFKTEMIAAKQYLESRGFQVILPELKRYQHIRDELDDEERFTTIKAQLTRQNISNVEKCDCLLILNYDHRGYRNYVGGNSFLEMAIAFYRHKPIYLLHDIPESMPYTEEIKALSPIVLGSLERLVCITGA
jgi:nucleoside 2-deoxyribosyltransferase